MIQIDVRTQAAAKAGHCQYLVENKPLGQILQTNAGLDESSGPLAQAFGILGASRALRQ